MATIGYGMCLLVSLIAIIIMAQKNYDNIDIHYWAIMVLIPIVILSYWLKTLATAPEAARFCFCFAYLDSTILLALLIFALLHTLGVKAPAWSKVVIYSIAMGHLIMVCLCVNNDLYYKQMTIVKTEFGNATKMESGPLKIIHYVLLALFIAIIVTILVAAFMRKGTYSRRAIYLYSLVVGVGIVMYVVEMLVDVNFTCLPYLYAATEVLIVGDYDHVHMHDLTSLVSTHYDDTSGHGYVAIDLSRAFLNCNEQSCHFLPELKKQRVDQKLKSNDDNIVAIDKLIDDFERDGKKTTEFTVGDIVCMCDISYFSVRKDGKKQGYLLDLRDATEEKRNLEILSNYNDMLNEEVAQKTEHISNIQRKIVLGMANMIENRDNNTGGHVKRTSDIISIIVDEIKRQGRIDISEEMAIDIVRAAPMHDLGKLHIDSSILCKPGKLTDEEYAIMKTHSTKSAEMVMILLDGVEEEHFVKVAYNVARYHHERWDGRGYPDGLVGGMIPIEARIMAIADVYDALVSKRCYKEAMSFEKASDIMCENMGTQFDPNMRQVFLGCREKLEEYYRNAPTE